MKTGLGAWGWALRAMCPDVATELEAAVAADLSGEGGWAAAEHPPSCGPIGRFAVQQSGARGAKMSLLP